MAVATPNAELCSVGSSRKRGRPTGTKDGKPRKRRTKAQMTASCSANGQAAGIAEQNAFDVAQDAMITSYLSSHLPLGPIPSAFEGDREAFAPRARCGAPRPQTQLERALSPFWQNLSSCISDETENNGFLLNQLLHDISRPLDWAMACDVPCERNYEPEELVHLPMRRMLIPAQALMQHKDSAKTCRP